MDNFPYALSLAIKADLERFEVKAPELLNRGAVAFAQLEASRRMGEDFLKKFEKSNPAADEAAIQLFIEMNSRCKSWIAPTALPPEAFSSADEVLWNTFLTLMDDFFSIDVGPDCELTNSNIVRECRHGPGAAIGARGFSFYAKTAASPVTSTSAFLDDMYQATLFEAPYATTSESLRRQWFGAPVRVLGSRMSVVPKNEKISRLICVEPSVNQYLQLGIGEILSKRLRRLLSIDLSVQPDVNRFMAFSGSCGDRDFSTVDLKSASDTLSLGLMGACLPPEVLSTLGSYRSPRVQVGGRVHDLSMMSTMGNGFTFPLQTIVFSCAVLASMWCDGTFEGGFYRRSHGRPWLIPSGLASGWSVFGDDIILPSSSYHKLRRLLELMGCITNEDKSFSSGGFRESCGRDFYHGYNVRPAYLRKLSTRADFTVALNQLLSWSRRTCIPLPSALFTLLKEYRRRRWKLNIVPMAENDDAGLRVDLDMALAIAPPKRNLNGSFIYECRKSRPRTYTIRQEGKVVGPKGSKSLKYNPDGLLRAFLLGEIRNGQIIARRNGPVPYSTTRRVTPNWDYMSTQEHGFSYASDVPLTWRVVASSMIRGFMENRTNSVRNK